MKPTLGQKLADLCSAFIGSWKFVGLQSTLLLFWITFNTLAVKKPDPYPFILLNLMLSFSAAYSAPLILMAANRQSEIDRERAIENLNLDRMDHAELQRLSEHLHQHFTNKYDDNPS